ncbi:capsule assembly Wzi family protein [Labilibaculum antarcticum]|uniref:Capsule assembly Wzi family protein n=1 Tax=Labilibaculum antarcticum TaxID=1717717 RepID=A0A1Y1CE35_9BACT|nr:capsule assembly Wzi family protein [Labilibaculum antarcticum]BAX78619.1 hypothetical protein ALGA_0224 [Labilibaculum antarcticum]
MIHKKLVIAAVILCFVNLTYGQKKVNYELGATTNISSKSNLPFWSVSNQNGRIPNENSLVTDLSVFTQFTNSDASDFDHEFGLSLSGSIADDVDGMISQAYGRFRWKKLQLSVGSRYEDIQFDNLSAINGNLFLSNNARPIPRISIGTQDYWELPYIGDWVSVKGMFSEGIMLDDRYVANTRVHYKNVYVKLGGDRKLNLVLGFQHYVQYDGRSSDPEIGEISTNLENYARMLVAKGGTEGQLAGEVENALGNHLGGWDIHVHYKTEKVDWELYRQTMFEDHSGIYITRPDGVTGLFARFKAEKALVQSVMYENYYTKYQSGSLAGVKPDGGLYTGRDSYFNNGIYRSGWTHYGRTLGIPFFTPKEVNEDGFTLGVSNNRIVAHHLGIKGHLFHKVPYRTLISYSQNWGTYGNQEGVREQLSAMLELQLPKNTLPFEMSFAITMDQGEMYKDNVGCFLRIYKKGIF